MGGARGALRVAVGMKVSGGTVRVALVGGACRVGGAGLQRHGVRARVPAGVGDLQWERHGTRVRRWTSRAWWRTPISGRWRERRLHCGSSRRAERATNTARGAALEETST